MTAPSIAADSILDVLRHREARAAFVSEIQAEVGAGDIEAPLRQLVDSRRILLLTEPAPDPHLESFDLRVAALVDEGDEASALEAARAIWDGWVRQFLANHRCQ
jgi:hypothetical protein